MTIRFKQGDLFAERADALINTVNCVGVMGKGVALEFKQRWPDNFRAYKKVCDAKQLRPGQVFVYERPGLFDGEGPRFIVNFPTKDHWRTPSRIAFIERGLDALILALRKSGITSVALPPLGCGNGGLAWEEVRPLIENKLGDVPGLAVTVLEPKATHSPAEYRVPQLTMSYPRAVLLKALGDTETFFGGEFDRISLQKIVYFLQALGVPFGLSFRRNLFGPYSEVLRKAFVTLERSGMLMGFTSPDRLARVTPAAYALADEYLGTSPQRDRANETIDRLSKLVEGYEGPYGLELLSSVHHLAVSDSPSSADDIVSEMADWSEAKRNKFPAAVVKGAYSRLLEDNLLATHGGVRHTRNPLPTES